MRFHHDLDSDALPVFGHISLMIKLVIKQNVNRSSERKKQAVINAMPHSGVTKRQKKSFPMEDPAKCNK